MARRREPRWNGLLPVFKKSGPTSHDVVDIARRALKERRIGHTGTLDPMAEGILLLCIGKATRLQQYLLSWEKEYLGIVRLGWATGTYDTEGEMIGEKLPVPEISRDDLKKLEEKFSNSFEQTPPPYSAKKIAGKKAYELARKGRNVEIQPKEVRVHSIGIEAIDAERLSVRLSVSSGFYVRSLAHDIGRELGCGGHLEHLTRLKIGPFDENSTVRQEDVEHAESPAEILEHPAWHDISAVPLPFPTVRINSQAARRFVNGQSIIIQTSADGVSGGGFVGLKCDQSLIGIGSVRHMLARGRTLDIQPTLVLQPNFGT